MGEVVRGLVWRGFGFSPQSPGTVPPGTGPCSLWEEGRGTRSPHSQLLVFPGTSSHSLAPLIVERKSPWGCETRSPCFVNSMTGRGCYCVIIIVKIPHTCTLQMAAPVEKSLSVSGGSRPRPLSAVGGQATLANPTSLGLQSPPVQWPRPRLGAGGLLCPSGDLGQVTSTLQASISSSAEREHNCCPLAGL